MMAVMAVLLVLLVVFLLFLLTLLLRRTWINHVDCLQVSLTPRTDAMDIS
jgi:hypothetical protein